MKTITFITGTRADYGKIKSLILELQKKKNKFKTHLIITGMHNIRKYGFTKDEIVTGLIINLTLQVWILYWPIQLKV